MKLKKLSIHGFKSFKDRTTIMFDDGITGIVGPNGCGKSNIVDALFWVMGEQSAKHLRGASMKDVIFSGSSKYNPGTWAEVILVLENLDGKHIHIGNKVLNPLEIQITRKLYRNGESEYRINGMPCRLRDVQEVFMDTGAGAKSYSIIAQGEINRLVQAKPEERRTMIEEVAGITKFKMRKKESLRKIEQTQLNLGRLNDLQAEIDKNLSSLKTQAEKAEKARSLKDKIHKNELTVDSHKIFDLLRNFREIKSGLIEKKIGLETDQTRKETLEIGLEDERLKRDEFTERIENLQKEYNEISRLLASSEERLNYLRRSEKEKTTLMEMREKELTEIMEDLENRKERINKLELEKTELEKVIDKGHDFSDLEEKVENLKEELESMELEASELSATISTDKNDLFTKEQELAKNSSRLEEYANTLQDITSESDSLENQYSGVSSEISDEREEVINIGKNVDQFSTQENELKEIVENLDEQYKSLTNEYSEKQKESIKLESRYTSLKELNESLEGVKNGASKFLKSTNSDKFNLLAAMIRCDEKYTPAVQNLMTGLMDILVSNDDNDSCHQFFSWFMENKNEIFDFFEHGETDKNDFSETIERLKLNLGNDVIPLFDVISVPEKFKENIRSLFDGHYIVPNLSSENLSQLPKHIQFKVISSLDGNIRVSNLGSGLCISSSGDKNAESNGRIDRNNKIISLESDCKIRKQEVEHLSCEVSSCRNILNDKKLQHEDIKNKLAEIKATHAVKKSTLDSKLANFESWNARLEILGNRKSEISKNRLGLLEKEEQLTKQIETTRERLEDLICRYDDFISDISSLKSTYEENRTELVQKQIEIETIDSRFKSLASQMDDVEFQITRLETRLDSGKNQVEEYGIEINKMNNDARELDQHNQKVVSNLVEREDILNAKKEQLSSLLVEMQEREDEVKSLVKNINKAEKKTVEYEMKLDRYVEEEQQIVRNIFEKYQMDLRKTIGDYLEFIDSDYEQLHDISSMYVKETENGTEEITPEPYQFEKRYGNEIKNCENNLKQFKSQLYSLGEINWAAIEDYRRQKKRSDFLKKQEVELKESLNDLEKAITHIDQKSNDRFRIAFEEVNSRFEKVFPVIFGGGEASLKVIGDINTTECGIDIMARPPGKRMQNINLMSGGEKAMTAVSLIFSIFLVKPSPFCLLDEVDAPLDDANIGRFNELLREMSNDSQFILITHNKKTMEMNDTLYGITMQEAGISKAVSVQLH